jgi:hypothetical protein
MPDTELNVDEKIAVEAEAPKSEDPTNAVADAGAQDGSTSAETVASDAPSTVVDENAGTGIADAIQEPGSVELYVSAAPPKDYEGFFASLHATAERMGVKLKLSVYEDLELALHALHERAELMDTNISGEINELKVKHNIA